MEKESKTNPPYIAIKKIELLFDKVTSRTYEKIDRQILMSYGFSDGESSQAVGTLTFLNIINKDKIVNKELVASIGARNDDKKIDGLRKMVESAYSDLFKAFPGVATASNDDVYDEIKRVYNLSPRVATTAAPAFIYLCELAGLREKSETKTTRATTKKSPKSSASKPLLKKTPPEKKSVIPEEINSNSVVIGFSDDLVKLVLPQDVMTNTELIDEYKTLVSAVNTFVTKYKTNNPPKENAG